MLGEHGFMDMAKTILITGATGTVGSEVITQLSRSTRDSHIKAPFIQPKV